MKVNYIGFSSDISVDFYFHGGILLISDTLSTESKLAIIRDYMEGV